MCNSVREWKPINDIDQIQRNLIRSIDWNFHERRNDSEDRVAAASGIVEDGIV